MWHVRGEVSLYRNSHLEVHARLTDTTDTHGAHTSASVHTRLSVATRRFRDGGCRCGEYDSRRQRLRGRVTGGQRGPQLGILLLEPTELHHERLRRGPRLVFKLIVRGGNLCFIRW